MGTSRMAAVTLERANGTAPSVELREGVLRCQRSLFAMLSFFEQPAYTAFEVERTQIVETIQSGCLADAILALEIIEPLPAAAVTAKKPPKSARVRAAHPVITGVETADRIAARGKTLSVLEPSLATGLTTKKIYAMIQRGTIPHQLIDGQFEFDPAITAAWWRSTAV